MLRFNSKLDAEDKALDNDKIDFYQMILNFDKIFWQYCTVDIYFLLL